MKKLITLFLPLTFILALVACGQQGQNEDSSNGQDYFDAAVLEVHDNYILAECLELTSGAVSPGTEARVSTEVVAAKGIPEVTIGDNVRVVFTGVQESDPLGFDTVFAIYLLDEDGEPIDLE